MFFPSTSVFPCQYHSTNAPYPFIHLPPTVYNVSLPVLQFPLSVPFHQSCTLTHLSSTLHIFTKWWRFKTPHLKTYQPNVWANCTVYYWPCINHCVGLKLDLAYAPKTHEGEPNSKDIQPKCQIHVHTNTKYTSQNTKHTSQNTKTTGQTNRVTTLALNRYALLYSTMHMTASSARSIAKTPLPPSCGCHQNHRRTRKTFTVLWSQCVCFRNGKANCNKLHPTIHSPQNFLRTWYNFLIRIS